MARPETLIPGNCYFSVSFYDNDLVLPMIDTLVYVGHTVNIIRENVRRRGTPQPPKP